MTSDDTGSRLPRRSAGVQGEPQRPEPGQSGPRRASEPAPANGSSAYTKTTRPQRGSQGLGTTFGGLGDFLGGFGRSAWQLTARALPEILAIELAARILGTILVAVAGQVGATSAESRSGSAPPGWPSRWRSSVTG